VVTSTIKSFNPTKGIKNMPIKTTFDEIMTNAEQFGVSKPKLAEYEGLAKVVKLEKHKGQSGKTSIKVTLSANSLLTSVFLPTGDYLKDTVQKLFYLALKGGMTNEDLKKLTKKISEDEDTNSDEEFATELANKLSRKFENGTLNWNVWLERKKEKPEDKFCNNRVKWDGVAPEEN